MQFKRSLYSYRYLLRVNLHRCLRLATSNCKIVLDVVDRFRRWAVYFMRQSSHGVQRGYCCSYGWLECRQSAQVDRHVGGGMAHA